MQQLEKQSEKNKFGKNFYAPKRKHIFLIKPLHHYTYVTKKR